MKWPPLAPVHIQATYNKTTFGTVHTHNTVETQQRDWVKCL